MEPHQVVAIMLQRLELDEALSSSLSLPPWDLAPFGLPTERAYGRQSLDAEHRLFAPCHPACLPDYKKELCPFTVLVLYHKPFL